MIGVAHPRVRVSGPPEAGLTVVFTATVDNATALLGFPAIRPQARTLVADIQRRVGEHYGLTQEVLNSDRRSRDVARPRQVSMWLCKQLTTRSLPDIGRRHGQRDHTTVLHAVRRIEALRVVDPVIANDCVTLLAALGGVPA